MRKLVVALELIILFAIAIWLVTQPGLVSIEWGQYHVEADLSVGYLILISSFIALAIVFKTWRFIVLLPSRMYAYSQKLRPEKGLTALSQSVIATALEERDQARSDAHRFERFLGDNPVYKALLAYNNMAEGKFAEARLVCENMKNDANAKTLSWILEAKIAFSEGKDSNALMSLQNLYSMHERSPWVIKSLLKCALKLQQYDLALEVLKKAERNSILTAIQVKSTRAFIFFQQASVETLTLDQKENLLEGAHRLAPEMITIALQYSKILRLLDKTKRAKKIIEQTWALHPHVDLLDEYVAIEPEADTKAIMKLADKLVGYNEFHGDSYLAIASFAMKLSEWGRVRAALHDYQEKHKMNQEACYLMARLELSQHADQTRYREWMERALTASKVDDKGMSLESLSKLLD